MNGSLNEVASLLFIHEKVRQLPHLSNIYATVHARLIELDATFVKEQPEQKTQDEMTAKPQPTPPNPQPGTDLSEMNHPAEERIENQTHEEPTDNIPPRRI